MNYPETLDKVEAYGLNRANTIMLILAAEDFGSQSLGGVRVTADELADDMNYSYDVYGEI